MDRGNQSLEDTLFGGLDGSFDQEGELSMPYFVYLLRSALNNKIKILQKF